MAEDLITYGARCTWWDTIDKTGMVPGTLMDPTRPRSGLPCCPHCGSVLFQIESPKWFEGMDKHEAAGAPGYVELMTWARGRCFPNFGALRHAYAADTGKPVPPP